MRTRKANCGVGQRGFPALEHWPGELHDIRVRPPGIRLLRLNDGNADSRDDADQEAAN